MPTHHHFSGCQPQRRTSSCSPQQPRGSWTLAFHSVSGGFSIKLPPTSPTYRESLVAESFFFTPRTWTSNSFHVLSAITHTSFRSSMPLFLITSSHLGIPILGHLWVPGFFYWALLARPFTFFWIILPTSFSYAPAPLACLLHLLTCHQPSWPLTT